MNLTEFEKLRVDLIAMPLVQKNITAPRNLGIKYVKYRMLRPILRAKYHSFQKKNPQAPWLSPGSIYILQKLLTKDMVGFEFGGGRSTLFYARLLRHIDSVEHDKPWFKKLETMLKETNTQNATLKLIHLKENPPLQHFSSEQQLFMTAGEYPIKDSLFKDYFNVLDNYADDYFHFIAVDGRARKSCVLKAIPKLKTGGFILLDNSERRRYSEALEALSGWPRIDTTTGLTDTTIWMKP